MDNFTQNRIEFKLLGFGFGISSSTLLYDFIKFGRLGIFCGIGLGVTFGGLRMLFKFGNYHCRFIKPNKKCLKCRKKRIMFYENDNTYYCKYHNLDWIYNNEIIRYVDIIDGKYSHFLAKSGNMGKIRNGAGRLSKFDRIFFPIFSCRIGKITPIDISIISKNFREFTYLENACDYVTRKDIHKFISILCVKYNDDIFDFIKQKYGISLEDFNGHIMNFGDILNVRRASGRRISVNRKIKSYVLSIHFLISSVLLENADLDIASIVLEKIYVCSLA